jgi:copper chaperone
MAGPTETLSIRGMTCGDCARVVAESLLGVEGVDDVDVDLDRATATIELNGAEPATREALVKAVQEAGYSVDRAVQA